MSVAEMNASRAAGELALYWEAHDTQYAIPKNALEAALAAGKRCVLNVSRGVTDECRALYESDDCEVYFLLITASDKSLIKRLTGRARESAEDIAKRVRRACEGNPVGPHVIVIYNEASREEGSAMVRAALLGELKYSLWLCPVSHFALFLLVSFVLLRPRS